METVTATFHEHQGDDRVAMGTGMHDEENPFGQRSPSKSNGPKSNLNVQHFSGIETLDENINIAEMEEAAKFKNDSERLQHSDLMQIGEYYVRCLVGTNNRLREALCLKLRLMIKDGTLQSIQGDASSRVALLFKVLKNLFREKRNSKKVMDAAVLLLKDVISTEKLRNCMGDIPALLDILSLSYNNNLQCKVAISVMNDLLAMGVPVSKIVRVVIKPVEKKKVSQVKAHHVRLQQLVGLLQTHGDCPELSPRPVIDFIESFVGYDCKKNEVREEVVKVIIALANIHGEGVLSTFESKQLKNDKRKVEIYRKAYARRGEGTAASAAAPSKPVGKAKPKAKQQQKPQQQQQQQQQQRQQRPVVVTGFPATPIHSTTGFAPTLQSATATPPTGTKKPKPTNAATAKLIAAFANIIKKSNEAMNDSLNTDTTLSDGHPQGISTGASISMNNDVEPITPLPEEKKKKKKSKKKKSKKNKKRQVEIEDNEQQQVQLQQIQHQQVQVQQQQVQQQQVQQQQVQVQQQGIYSEDEDDFNFIPNGYEAETIDYEQYANYDYEQYAESNVRPSMNVGKEEEEPMDYTITESTSTSPPQTTTQSTTTIPDMAPIIIHPSLNNTDSESGSSRKGNESTSSEDIMLVPTTPSQLPKSPTILPSGTFESPERIVLVEETTPPGTSYSHFDGYVNDRKPLFGFNSTDSPGSLSPMTNRRMIQTASANANNGDANKETTKEFSPLAQRMFDAHSSPHHYEDLSVQTQPQPKQQRLHQKQQPKQPKRATVTKSQQQQQQKPVQQQASQLQKQKQFPHRAASTQLKQQAKLKIISQTPTKVTSTESSTIGNKPSNAKNGNVVVTTEKSTPVTVSNVALGKGALANKLQATAMTKKTNVITSSGERINVDRTQKRTNDMMTKKQIITKSNAEKNINKTQQTEKSIASVKPVNNFGDTQQQSKPAVIANKPVNVKQEPIKKPQQMKKQQQMKKIESKPVKSVEVEPPKKLKAIENPIDNNKPIKSAVKSKEISMPKKSVTPLTSSSMKSKPIEIEDDDSSSESEGEIKETPEERRKAIGSPKKPSSSKLASLSFPKRRSPRRELDNGRRSPVGSRRSPVGNRNMRDRRDRDLDRGRDRDRDRDRRYHDNNNINSNRRTASPPPLTRRTTREVDHYEKRTVVVLPTGPSQAGPGISNDAGRQTPSKQYAPVRSDYHSIPIHEDEEHHHHHHQHQNHHNHHDNQSAPLNGNEPQREHFVPQQQQQSQFGRQIQQEISLQERQQQQHQPQQQQQQLARQIPLQQVVQVQTPQRVKPQVQQQQVQRLLSPQPAGVTLISQQRQLQQQHQQPPLRINARPIQQQQPQVMRVASTAPVPTNPQFAPIGNTAIRHVVNPIVQQPPIQQQQFHRSPPRGVVVSSQPVRMSSIPPVQILVPAQQQSQPLRFVSPQPQRVIQQVQQQPLPVLVQQPMRIVSTSGFPQVVAMNGGIQQQRIVQQQQQPQQLNIQQQRQYTQGFPLSQQHNAGFPPRPMISQQVQNVQQQPQQQQQQQRVYLNPSQQQQQQQQPPPPARRW
eukprot:TRINITY_DN413_c0_g2_i1.p1 TRINITY_DN413_c0_g2~~TRINITY_DN413_c0_g2_i1.p1  ORF type:complete len:1808 (-),score=866.99 TRINITY_DN413_c0_g2_i1:12-4661(-)